MKNIFRKLTACIVAFALLNPCVFVNADAQDRYIQWIAEGCVLTLSDLPEGNHSEIKSSIYNKLEIKFENSDVSAASVIIVPVVDGKAQKPTPQNTILLSQSFVEDGVAEFDFYLKPSTENGTYALMVGGNGVSYVTKYFEINNSDVNNGTAPKLAANQSIQYDGYKEKIVLSYENVDRDDFEKWTSFKENMTVELEGCGNTVSILPEDIDFDTTYGTITINMADYAWALPDINEDYGELIHTYTLAISTPGYWNSGVYEGARKEEFSLLTPKLSAEGFAAGVDFDIEVYSDTAQSDVYPIVALYDDGNLVDCIMCESFDLESEVNKTVTLNIKNEELAPSDDFKIKVFFWQSDQITPLTPFVIFP